MTIRYARRMSRAEAPGTGRRRLTRDGFSCTAEDVLIIQGGQQGLDLAAKPRTPRTAPSTYATFFPVEQEPNHARLSFSGVPDDRLVRGITEFGPAALSAQLIAGSGRCHY
jgi:DNA-binding transcriptional MocR family regulator